MHAKAKSALVALSAVLLASVAGTALAADPLIGFSPAGSDAQRALEARFDANLSAADIQARHAEMASGPNQIGAPHNKANAEAVLARFKAWGWDARIETFDVLYPTPISVSLEMTAPTPFKAALNEPPVPGDKSSNQAATVLPPYVVYGADGDVTAELVYVNYGMPDDYKALGRMGVSVKGKIVIVRYGAGFRGLKPHLAYEHGAIGCVIYSEPADDGYGAGLTYPDGAWRPGAGVQRGSVVDLSVSPGDPLTPGWASVKGARRLLVSEAPTIQKIPVLPISYADAQPLLAAIGGQTAPAAWRGALPLTYRVGPGPATARLSVKSEWGTKTLYNVIAKLPGAASDQWVLRGNHRDGWVMGASDPLSGHEAMMEEAKALGGLVKGGWRPARTIVYASWDGEEAGLLGSTEWVEAHADELTRKGVIYVNSDNTGRGLLRADGSFSLQRLVNQAAAEVRDPETGVDVRTRGQAAAQVRAASSGASDPDRRIAKAVAEGGDLPISPMGSGSDYTPFNQHLGVPSVDLRYAGEEEAAGVYHSLYDTYEHFHRFGDPDASYQVALAKTAGRVIMRAADAEVLPLRFEPLAVRVEIDLADLRGLAAKTRDGDVALNTLIAAKAFALADDPKDGWVAPAAQPVGPDLDLKALEDASARLKASAGAYDAALAAAASLTPERRAKLNALLQKVEFSLTAPEGLPGRPWYRHVVSAPGLLTGYGAKTLPAVREAIEGRRWSEAQAGVATTARALDACSALLDQATALLKG
jgi:N-acetylated-alpha-linked acidic dipeptidase